MSKLTWTLLLVGSMAGIAAFYPIAKMFDGADALFVGFFRFALASLALLPIVLYRHAFRLPEWRHLTLLAFIALCGVIPTVFIVIGIEQTTSVVAAILINTNPLVIALLSPLLISEVVTTRKKLGLIVGFVGVVSVVLNGEDPLSLFNSTYVWGAFILLIAAVFAGLNKIYSKGLVRIYDGLFVTFFATFIGSAMLALLLAFTGKFAGVAEFSGPQMLALIAAGIVCTAIPWSIWASSLKHLDVHVAASFNLLIPIFAALYSLLLFDEQFTRWILAGMLLTSIGVYIVQKEEPPPAPIVQ